MTAFVLLPLAQTAGDSFFDGNLVSPVRSFVGFANYTAAFENDFGALVAQSGLYVAAALIGNVVIPFGLALVTLRLGEREADIAQSLIFVPTVVPVSIGALLFVWILLPVSGPLDTLLATVHLGSPNWLTDRHWALASVATVTAWKFFGFTYLIVLAGLRAIPRSVLEAAAIDGASPLRRLAYVVIPLALPTLVFASVTTILGALENAFVPTQILTLGGPGNASNQLVYAIFQAGFQYFQRGQAAALGVLMLLLFAAFGVWQFRLLDRYVVYER
ncbi:MAG: sugar ABC transporter permease [Candidatus Velthaea sp.]